MNCFKLYNTVVDAGRLYWFPLKPIFENIHILHPINKWAGGRYFTSQGRGVQKVDKSISASEHIS